MSRICVLATVVLALAVTPAAQADLVSPDSSYVVVSSTCRFTGAYRYGEPKDVITISPSHTSETLASAGITVRVFLRNAQGQPIAGVPATSIRLVTQGGCTCVDGNYADGPTSLDGSTTFTGRVDGGGCGNMLAIQVDGVQVATVAIRFNSPDMRHLCVNEVEDNLPMATAYGTRVGETYYSVCQDLNEDGKIDLTDLSIFTTMRTTYIRCGPVP